jgi:hypothetical protein
LGTNPFQHPPNRSINEAEQPALASTQPSKFNRFKGKAAVGDSPPVEDNNFMPAITAPGIGSSANNWRCTDHATANTAATPPPANIALSDVALLITELKAQREDNRLRHDQHAVRQCRKADRDKQARITTIVAAVSKRFKEPDILKPNGSNYLRQWERTLRLHASKHFGDPDFFTPPEDAILDCSGGKIARGIIHALVHSDLTYNLLNLDSAANVFKHLMLKFLIMNRAAQIQAWLDFISTDPAKHNTTASLFEAFSNL